MSVITVSKEAATDSEKVASLLAEKLGWEYIGKQLVARIAGELHISESDVEAFRQDAQSRLLRFVDRYTCSLIQKVVDREYGCLDDKNYFETTKRLVEDVYNAGNAIVIGWGGQCILRDKPNTLHVRLIKDREAKISAVMARHNLEREAAKDYIDREENDSKSYIRHYFKEDWNDTNLYDLIIDMEEASIEEAVETICDHLKKKTGLPTS